MLRWPRAAALLLCAVVALIVAPTLLAGSSGDGAPSVHVVSVGDSLAVGVQPGLNGVGRATGQGYPRQFADRLEDDGRDVELHELGCGGATSASVLDGGRECAPAGDQPYDNDDALTSQVAYAEGLLSRLSDQPTVVLVDIGGNDLGRCLHGVAPDLACVQRVGRDLRRNLAEVLGRLRAASPSATVAVLDLYDPILGLWDRVPAKRPEIAAFHEAFRTHVNPAIHAVAAQERAVVGRLGKAMHQDGPVDARASGTPPGVSAVCEQSWMCVRPPLLPDIHLRDRGYRAASDALLRAASPALSTMESPTR